jgi:hypothetical protein
MRSAFAFLSATCVAAAGLTATVLVHPNPGQQNPDFSGTWVATRDVPTTVPVAPSAVFGERFAAKQDATHLTMLRPIRGRATAVTTAFPLDGSELRVMSIARPCFGQSGQIITTAWDAGALRYSIVGTIPAGGGPPNRIAAHYRFKKIDADTVVIEASMRDATTGQPTPVGTVYKRSTDVLTPEAATPPPVAPATIAQVAWLSGDWQMEGGTATAPSTVEERWSPGNGGAMIATSRTVRNTVMTEFEFLCISERNGTLVYTAMPNAGTATDFTLTTIDADSATFENPAHNFPKMIRYARRPDGTMAAVVSGAATSKPITFVFTRKQQ